MRFLVGVIAMLTFAKVFNGLAEETNSPAVIEDLFAAPLPTATNTPPRLLPSINAAKYLIEGNRDLTVDKFNFLTNYLGKLDITRLHEGLDKLQLLYHSLGFSNVIVTLPDQKCTNGVIRVQIVDQMAEPAETNWGNALTNLFAAPKPTLPVRGYLIEGNSVLPAEKFGFLTNYIGDLDFEKLREGLGKLQLLYHDLGFATISVTLPQQKLTNGIVRVVVFEGKLSHIVVTDNRYFNTENVRRALPSLDTNILLNTKWFQPELDRANLNQDRQIYPVISPGPEPGTSDLTLKIKDRLPLHAHFEINDKSPPDTPLLRLDTAVQYGNLWQREHQIGFDYNFSPQAMKSGSYWPDFYNQPMVASYSGYYRLPLGFGHSLRENYDHLPVDFGYSEITHRFNLPPATGNPDLIFYGSGSSTENPVRYGPTTIIFTNTFQDVTAQSAERDLTYDDNLGTKLTVPLRQFWNIQSSFLAGFDYKYYDAQGFSTNLTTFAEYAPDPSNPINRGPLVTNLTVALPTNTRNTLYYMPFSLGWVASRSDASGAFSFNYNQYLFFQGLESPKSDFQTVAGSPEAGGNFTTLTAGLVRQQNLPDNWSAILNANGQWASEPLINNEQFPLGGTSGVRGYPEAATYGDTGWRVLFDLRAPPVNVGYLPTQDGDVSADLRCSWFMDYGQAYGIDRSNFPTVRQWGTGLGFFLTAGEHLSARLTLAWALHDTPTTAAGNTEAYFSVGFQF